MGILLYLGAIIQYYHYLFYCSNCSSMAIKSSFGLAPASLSYNFMFLFFEYFLTLWPSKMLQAHLGVSFPTF
uniref:Uncharacterized protein n=1 Tax=Moschus moschiferus TaxID=68415 RepID=A0A8C6FTB4_MOSMO